MLHIWIHQALVPVALTYVFLDWISGLFARGDGKVSLECAANKSSSASEKARKLSGGNGNGDDDDTASIAITNTTASISDSNDGEGGCQGGGEIIMERNVDKQEIDSSTSSASSSMPTKYCIVLTGANISKHLHLVRCLRAHQLPNPATIEIKIVFLDQDKFCYDATRFSNCVDAFSTNTSPRVSLGAYATSQTFSTSARSSEPHTSCRCRRLPRPFAMPR